MMMDNISVNTVYNRIDGIKKVFLDHESALKSSFNEATILPIPDDAPIEIPRIIVKTKHEHTQLNIAPESASMITQFTDGYVNDWELCKKYIEEKSKDLFNLFDKITSDNIQYIGVVTNLIWSTDGYNNEKLYNNLFGKVCPNNLDDLLVKYTFINDSKYYVNITIQSVRTENSFMPDDNQRSIAVTLDINDRFQYNINKNYKSDRNKLENILGLTDDIIANKLKILIEEGRC